MRMHASPFLRHIDGELRKGDSRRFSGDMRVDLHRASLPLTGQTMFRREDCVQFDPSLRIAEDLEWWIRMWDRGEFAWSDEPGLVIRHHTTPRVETNDDTRFRSKIAVLERHRHLLARDPKSYANHLRRAGSAAYLARCRRTTISLAIQSLWASPSTPAIGLLARALAPRPMKS